MIRNKIKSMFKNRLRNSNCTDEYDESHNWYQFDENEWKCSHCGLVIGWPYESHKESMGIVER